LACTQPVAIIVHLPIQSAEVRTCKAWAH
jgi:hypothetical protein